MKLKYRRVKLSGVFDHEMEILLNNRYNVWHTSETYFNMAGFYVLTPLLLNDGRRVLVNRGYVSPLFQDANRRSLGQVNGPVEFNAYVVMEDKVC